MQSGDRQSRAGQGTDVAADGVSRRHRGRSWRARPEIFGLLFAALVLTACGKPQASLLSPPTKSTASLFATAGAPLDCGTYVLSQGEETPETAYRCFIKAVGSGRPAQLKQTKPTTEGDPIPITYMGGRKGKVAVTTDSRSDAFGSKVVTRAVCSGVTLVQGRLTFATCSPA